MKTETGVLDNIILWIHLSFDLMIVLLITVGQAVGLEFTFVSSLVL